MSELIDNRKHRQETLKGIIRDIHGGASIEEIKVRFGELLDQVGPTEISEIEQSLIDEGLPIEEVQQLCDVHVAVFKESLERQRVAETLNRVESRHPIYVLQESNQEFQKVVSEIRMLVQSIGEIGVGKNVEQLLAEWKERHERLTKVEEHYSRKENILFPYLERYGISGPPSVMWGIHDTIRVRLKEINQIIEGAESFANPGLSVEIGNVVLPCLNEISEMIYKEDNILFPMCMDTLTQDEWAEIAVQLEDPTASIYRERDGETAVGKTLNQGGRLELDVGALTGEEINLLLTHLPVDITYVDENDEVRFFSLGPERIFERTRAVIGRNVQNCHPPASMHIVDEILDDFRSGKRDHADFWINMRGRMVYIRYFAVRDKSGQYRGTLEVTQDITEIRQLSGEKRIYDDACL